MPNSITTNFLGGAFCLGVGHGCKFLGTNAESEAGIKVIACTLSAICFAIGFAEAGKQTYSAAKVAAPALGKGLKEFGNALVNKAK